MRRLLLLLPLLALCASPALAQWTFSGVFPENEDLQFSSTHGIAVDPDGKVYIQPFSATDSVQVADLDTDDDERDGFRDVQVIYVFESDGTLDQTIKFLDFPDGGRDTLGAFQRRGDNNEIVFENRSGRGLHTGPDGNIYASQFDTIYKIDYQTGEGLARVTTNDRLDGRGISEVATDDAGNVYVTGVFPGDPIAIYDSDLNYVGNVVDSDFDFNRDLLVSPDGNTLFDLGYSSTFVKVYQREDEFAAYDSVGVTARGLRAEAGAINPATGNYWFSSGPTASGGPNEDLTVETSYQPQTWYAFAPEDLFDANGDPVENPTPRDSIVTLGQGPVADIAQPRGIAFSPDGNTAYVSFFSQPAPSVLVYTRGGDTSSEFGPGLADGLTLDQNTPNPVMSRTEIAFSLEQPGHARLVVFDVTGREVARLVDEPMAAGDHAATLDAGQFAPGVYLYTLQVDDQRATRRMVVVR